MNLSWRFSGRQLLIKVNQRFVYIFSQQINMFRVFFFHLGFSQSKNMEKLSPNRAQLFLCNKLNKYTVLLWVALQLPICQQKNFRRTTVLQICRMVIVFAFIIEGCCSQYACIVMTCIVTGVNLTVRWCFTDKRIFRSTHIFS